MPTLLIAETDESQQQHIVANLPSERYETIFASTGEQALSMIKLHLPDLVLANVGLPGIDGYSLAQQIGQDRKLPHIPFVLMHRDDEQLDQDRADMTGARGVLAQPIDPATLGTLLETLVPLPPPEADEEHEDDDEPLPAPIPLPLPVDSAPRESLYQAGDPRVFVSDPRTGTTAATGRPPIPGPGRPPLVGVAPPVEPGSARGPGRERAKRAAGERPAFERLLELMVRETVDSQLDVLVDEIAARVKRKIIPELETLIIEALGRVTRRRRPPESEKNE